MANNLRWYTSNNTNAPQLTNDWGALLNIYKKCLVEGYGTLQPTSVSFANEYVTLTYASAHGYLQYQQLQVSGFNNSLLDTVHRIYRIDSTTQLTLKVVGNTLTSFTGTVTTLLPSLGWDLLYDQDTKGVFRSVAENGPNHCFFVQNSLPSGYTTTWAKFANTGMAEDWDYGFVPKGLTHPVNWNDINPSGSGTTMTLGHGKIFHNSSSGITNMYPNAGSFTGNSEWFLIGDESYFYLFHTPISSSSYFVGTGFGQYDSCHQNNSYGTFLHNMSYEIQTAGGSSNYALDTASLYSNIRNIKTLSGYNNTSLKDLLTTSYSGISYSGYSSILSAGGPVNLFKVYLRDTNSVLMGTLKNLYWLATPTPFVHRQIFRQGKGIYIAFTHYPNSITSQIVVKIGEMNE